MIYYFTITILFISFLKKYIGSTYALDKPDYRKQHKALTPQIGGLVFGPLLLFIFWFLELVPTWYLVGGIISIILGASDDVKHVPWKIKLFVQIIICLYLSFIFWGQFESITFYNYIINLPQVGLLIIFIIWFIGIYNAVNLLDGLDGLAGGFMLLITLGLSVSNSSIFSEINGIFALVLLGFMIYNQRPAMLFMGDAGSLFLGYHVAVLPLLYIENFSSSNSLIITPFLLFAFFLQADTTRVFLTRIVDKKSPMTADTIHFHHLILQQSSSYLASITSIYLVTLLSVIVGITSFIHPLSSNIMVMHLAFLLFFILTPPVETYVPLISKIIDPFYSWQKTSRLTKPLLFRTIFMIVLLFSQLFSFYYNKNIFSLFNWLDIVAFISLSVFVILNRDKKFTMYIIQIVLILIFLEIYWLQDIGTLSKIFSTLLLVSLIIFSLQKRIGCNFNKFSSLDILFAIVCFGGIILNFLGYLFSSWFFISLFSLWFASSFILRRTIYV